METSMFNFHLPVPADASSALRQAVRHERALQIIEEGYSFLFDAGTATVDVVKPGRLAAEYTIWLDGDINGRKGCDCPDMVKTGEPCKHYHAAMIVFEKRTAQEEEDAERCARYEETRRNAGIHESLLPNWYGG
jgi:hypothetical protein